MEKYHVAVAAEAHCAAAFAQAGYEVSVQYGANQPGYDLVVVRHERLLKVSVKGSQNGGWMLHSKFKKGNHPRQAVENWKNAVGGNTVMFFVQFHHVDFGTLPRMFLARAHEVAEHLLRGRANHVSGCLLESYRFTRGVARGHTDAIPAEWACSLERIDSVLATS